MIEVLCDSSTYNTQLKGQGRPSNLLRYNFYISHRMYQQFDLFNGMYVQDKFKIS
jgi:hypothetical protein